MSNRMGLYPMWLRAFALLVLAALFTTAGVVAASASASSPTNSVHSGGAPLPGSPRVPLDTPTGTPSPCSPVWSVVASPNVGTSDNFLEGVAAVSASDAWAVGYYFDEGGVPQALLEHWDGTAWALATLPNLTARSSILSGVTTVSAGDVWAVGGYDNGGTGQTLIEHWDGTAWSVVTSPDAGASDSSLSAVTAISSNDIWAVGGYYSVENSANQTLTEHWNGSIWQVVPSGSPGTYLNQLNAVAAASANDVWAVGYYVNGSGGAYQTLVEHWNGTSWLVVSSPNVGAIDNFLSGVAAIAANNVWAVGSYFADGGLTLSLIQHWDGTAWSVATSPDLGTGINSTLLGIKALSATDILAVGYYGLDGRTLQTLMEHWDGTAWSVVPSPNANANENILTAVAAVSANDMLAVGYYSIEGGIRQTLVGHYASPCAATPTPTATPILVGHLNWQGRPAQPSSLQQLPVTITLKTGAFEVNYPVRTTDASGFFTVPVSSLANGAYTWRVKGPKYLANAGPVNLNGSAVTTVEMGLLRVGDANNDNVVNVNDFTIMKSTFGKSVGQLGYDDRADFTGDQLVAVSDFTLLKGSFGLSGAPPLRSGAP